MDKVAQFNGSTYDAVFDHTRLSGQLKRVYDCMKDGVWRTLDEIAIATGDPHASVSAQLRHLRKEKFGSFEVTKRSRGDREKGLYEYHLSSPFKLNQPTKYEVRHDDEKALKYEKNQLKNIERVREKKKKEKQQPSKPAPKEKYVVISKTAAEQISEAEVKVNDPDQLSLF